MKRIAYFFRSTQSITSMLAALLTLMPLLATAQQQAPIQTTAQQQAQANAPTGEVTNGGGTTPAGTHYDYKKVTSEGTTYFRVLRSREEIDAFLVKQAQQIPTENNIRLREMAWTVMQHEWRRDPVTRQPITQFPPPAGQQAELVQAFKNRLGLSPEAADEFQAKLAGGNCIMHNSLDPTRMVVMVNGTGINEKMEVPAELAAKTRSCEFFLESVPVVINLVLICGNFGYDFVEYFFVANPKPPETNIERPGEAACVIYRNGQPVSATQPIKMGLTDSITFFGRSVGDISKLQLMSEVYVNSDLKAKMAFTGEQEFTIGPDVTNQQAGTYKVLFSLVDQFGRRSPCPFSVVIDRVEAQPPTTSFSAVPATAPRNPNPIVHVTEHHHGKCGPGKFYCWGPLLGLAVIPFVLGGDSAQKTPVAVFQGHP